jgi:hypothetical protein
VTSARGRITPVRTPFARYGKLQYMKHMKRMVLAILASLVVASPVAGAGRLDVDYRPPRLSVEADGQTLTQILGAIGAKVGFTVVDNGAPSEPMTVSIHDASVEDALRQLLRGTNHSLLYLNETTPGAAPIDKIVLLGTPGVAQPTPTPPDRPQVPTVPGPASSGASASNQPAARQTSETSAVVAPPAPQWNPLMSWDPGPNAEAANDPDASSVGDLLRLHAQSAAQAVTAPGGVPVPAAPAGNLEASLAETTRRAQQDLAALVKGLAAATRALQDSLVTAPK